MTGAVYLVTFALSAAPAGRESSLSPVATEHQEAGDRALLAREFAAAQWHYSRAYDLSRPLADQEAREAIRANLHRALRGLYEVRGDVDYLCQSRAFHERHAKALEREGLAAAVAPIRALIGDLEGEIARVSRRPTASVCTRGEGEGEGARRLRITGGIFVGVGGSILGLAAYALGVNIADYQQLGRLKTLYPEGPSSPERELAERLVEHGNMFRDVSIASAILGAAMTGVGVGLLVRARRELPGRLRLRAGPTGVGLTLRF